jgi:WD40 repeat protein
MHKNITGAAGAVAAAAALSALGATGAGASGSAAQAPARALTAAAPRAAAVPGAQLWIKRYTSWSRIPRKSQDIARSVAVSPTGNTVFVTGYRHAWPGHDYGTIDYNAATGTRLWIQRYNGPGNDTDLANSVAVSPTGGTVFVTGQSTGGNATGDYATVAYNAATGAQQWAQRYEGPGEFVDAAFSVAVSPRGGTVFVTGDSDGGNSGDDYTTIAYNAATGARLWAQRYNGPANSYDRALSVAVSPGGDQVFVTGYSPGDSSSDDYATIAYDAATGARQ